MNEIKFNRLKKPYGCFSNFYPCPIFIDGETWPSSEHYYQAMKFPMNPEIRALIQHASNPIGAKNIANKDYGYLVNWKKWNEIKVDVMLKVLNAKFSQHEDLKAILLSTGNDEIIEHTKNDSFWGDGGDGSGENMLGKLLMRVREELQNQDRA